MGSYHGQICTLSAIQEPTNWVESFSSTHLTRFHALGMMVLFQIRASAWVGITASVYLSFGTWSITFSRTLHGDSLDTPNFCTPPQFSGVTRSQLIPTYSSHNMCIDMRACRQKFKGIFIASMNWRLRPRVLVRGASGSMEDVTRCSNGSNVWRNMSAVIQWRWILSHLAPHLKREPPLTWVEDLTGSDEKAKRRIIRNLV